MSTDSTRAALAKDIEDAITFSSRQRPDFLGRMLADVVIERFVVLARNDRDALVERMARAMWERGFGSHGAITWETNDPRSSEGYREIASVAFAALETTMPDRTMPA